MLAFTFKIQRALILGELMHLCAFQLSSYSGIEAITGGGLCKRPKHKMERSTKLVCCTVTSKMGIN